MTGRDGDVAIVPDGFGDLALLGPKGVAALPLDEPDRIVGVAREARRRATGADGPAEAPGRPRRVWSSPFQNLVRLSHHLVHAEPELRSQRLDALAVIDGQVHAIAQHPEVAG